MLTRPSYRYLFANLCLILILLWRALDLRLAQLTRPLWGDEYHQIDVILRSTSLFDLRISMADQMQCLFDYALRKYFWFKFFGISELSTRIPSLFYSLLTVLVSYLGTVFFFNRKIQNRSYLASKSLSLFFAFIIGIYVSFNVGQIQYSVEARMYSWIALLSVIWCFYLLIADLNNLNRLFWVNLLFAQAHFFALPQIIFLYGILLFFHGLQVRTLLNRKIVILVSNLLIILGVTILINYPAWNAMRTGGTWTQVISLNTALRNTLPLLYDCAKFIRMPISFLVILPILLLFTLVGPRAQGSPKISPLISIHPLKNKTSLFLVFVFICLPAFFFYTRTKTEHPVFDRYFLPFFGFGPVLLVLFFDRFIFLFNLKRPLLLVASVFSILLVFKVHSNPRTEVVARVLSLKSNFTKSFEAYREAIQFQKPLFLIQSVFPEEPGFYFDYIFHSKVEFSESHDPHTLEKLNRFLERHSDALILLEEIVKPRCPKEAPVIEKLEIRKTNIKDTCGWYVTKAKSANDILEAAKSVGFTTFTETFQ